MSEAPDPHPWSAVEHRGRPFDAPAPPRRRTGVWLAAAACTIALLGGLVAVVASDDELSGAGTDDPDSTTPSTPTAPVHVGAGTDDGSLVPKLGWTGGLLDDIDVDSLRPLESSRGRCDRSDCTERLEGVGLRAWTGPGDEALPRTRRVVCRGHGKPHRTTTRSVRSLSDSEQRTDLHQHARMQTIGRLVTSQRRGLGGDRGRADPRGRPRVRRR